MDNRKRLAAFCQRNQNAITAFSVGMGVGSVLIYHLARKVMDGQYITGADHCTYDDGSSAIYVYLKNGVAMPFFRSAIANAADAIEREALFDKDATLEKIEAAMEAAENMRNAA